MQTKIAAGLVVAGVILMLMFSLIFAETPAANPADERVQPPAVATAQANVQSGAFTVAGTPIPRGCQESWAFLSEQGRQRCINAGGIVPLKATDEARLASTQLARPSTAPMSGFATSAALAEIAGTLTPTPTLPPDGIPAEDKRIEEVPPEGGGGSGRLNSRSYAGIWRVGAVLSDDRVLYAYYLATPKDTCQLVATTVGPDYSSLESYERTWSCPQDIGPIRITGVTGQTGVVSFTNYTVPPYVVTQVAGVTPTESTAQIGTFNLSTEEWTLAGQPWLTTVTVTPQP
jgi:hypothetical protein